MPRTERQLAMLEAMGIRVFGPRADVEPTPGVESEPPASQARRAEVTVDARPGPPSRRADDERAPAGPAARIALSPLSPASAVATLDWTALRDAVASCRACTLCETRTQTVFGVGHPQAHWMIVGEAPGEQEDLKGEPFVGAAGQLLDAMLRAIGLTRDEAPREQQVYIANTLKCRPPRNRNPSPDELAQCEPFLLRQIELVQPRVILAMGRFAVQSLLRTEDAIGRLRGRVHRCEGRPLVVTYHPAYLLRNPIDKARSWEDLCLAAEVVERTGDH